MPYSARRWSIVCDANSRIQPHRVEIIAGRKLEKCERQQRHTQKAAVPHESGGGRYISSRFLGETIGIN